MPEVFTKSGLMLVLGETKDEIMQVMDDLRAANVDFLTLGQYLQPTRKHAPIKDFITPDDFEKYKEIAESKGFLMVSSSPLTRSSHHAGDDFLKLKKIRLSQQWSKLIDVELKKYLEFPSDFLYDVMRDVNSYSKFIPGCNFSKIISGSNEKFIAKLNLKYLLMSGEFISEVSCDKKKLTIISL